jgi:DNA-directed RNA polymerase subunit H (RpoH/RPB5)
MNNQELIFKSFSTIIEMLSDRKIDTSGINKTIINDIIINNSNKIGFEINLENIKIIYYLSTKFKWSELKKFFEEKDDNSLYILIINDKISQNNMKIIIALGLTMQIFNIKELQFNITKHVLVPKHELITDQDEIKNIMDHYSLKSKFQLPLILKNDPISRYYGLKNGDIVKITRNSPSSGKYIIFRCCM